MEYTKSVGDYYEAFEGTPEEIAELIYNRLFPYNIPKDTIRQVLDAEMKYLQMKEIENNTSRMYMNKYTLQKL